MLLYISPGNYMNKYSFHKNESKCLKVNEVFDINKMSGIPIKIIYVCKLQYLVVVKNFRRFQENVPGGAILIGGAKWLLQTVSL